MVEQYPHKVKLMWNEEPVKDQDTGKWSEGMAVSLVVNGRFEPTGQSFNQEGNRVVYSFHGFLPKPQTPIPQDRKVKVQWDDGRVWDALRIHVYQTHVEVWI